MLLFIFPPRMATSVIRPVTTFIRNSLNKTFYSIFYRHITWIRHRGMLKILVESFFFNNNKCFSNISFISNETLLCMKLCTNRTESRLWQDNIIGNMDNRKTNVFKVESGKKTKDFCAKTCLNYLFCGITVSLHP